MLYHPLDPQMRVPAVMDRFPVTSETLMQWQAPTFSLCEVWQRRVGHDGHPLMRGIRTYLRNSWS